VSTSVHAPGASRRAAEALDGSLLDCAALVASRAVSPVDLTEEALRRAAQVGARLNCFVTVTPEVAMEQARTAEAELRQGRHRGRLHGIPYGLKDNFDTGGIPTTWGARPYADRIPSHDGTMAARLRQAGAVLVGKLSMTEMAGGFSPRFAQAALNGACRNPWDLSRSPGGSSSGPASAVAARIVSFALGTESLGSLLQPAAMCGVTAFRPTYGVLSRHGVLPFAFTLDKVGPMCRTALDCAAVTTALGGIDPEDPSSISLPPGLDGVRALRVAGLRAAVLDLPTSFPIPPEIEVFYSEALEVMAGLGLRLEPAQLPEFPWPEVAEVIGMAESEIAFEELIRSHRTNELADPNRLPEMEGRPSDYVRAMAIRSEMQRQMNEFFSRYDLILSANNPVLPHLLSEPKPAYGADVLRSAGNLLGLPAAAVPMGFVQPGKLPCGLAITGRLLQDATVLGVAAAFQARTLWHAERPQPS
jgi:aspartyl-tRNA(Asn)/glutamyl-tRNA(Gln) amidotransferase subunit A